MPAGWLSLRLSYSKTYFRFKVLRDESTRITEQSTEIYGHKVIEKIREVIKRFDTCCSIVAQHK